MNKLVPFVGLGCIVRDSGGRVLLMKRKGSHGSGTWSTPGGYLEHGESFEDCAIREVKEETGVTVLQPRFHRVTNDIFPDGGKHFVTVWMTGAYGGGELFPSEEIDELGWFEPNELPEPLFLSLRNLINTKGLE